MKNYSDDFEPFKIPQFEMPKIELPKIELKNNYSDNILKEQQKIQQDFMKEQEKRRIDYQLGYFQGLSGGNSRVDDYSSGYEAGRRIKEYNDSLFKPLPLDPFDKYK